MTMYEYLMNVPHILIGGTPGSGKSVLLNGIICDLMRTHSVDDTRFYLIDPKAVELYPYSKTLFCDGYTEEAEDVPSLLDDLIEEMTRRYADMRDRDIKDYDGGSIYLIIDELPDLMISDYAVEIRKKLQRILAKGRASKIHVIAATQAPNRITIPASLVLNFTDRIALRCVSPIESRQLINVSGAEKLPRYGKGLYLSAKGIEEISIPLTTDADVKEVCTKFSKPTIKPVSVERHDEVKPPSMRKVLLTFLAFLLSIPFGIPQFSIAILFVIVIELFSMTSAINACEKANSPR